MRSGESSNRLQGRPNVWEEGVNCRVTKTFGHWYPRFVRLLERSVPQRLYRTSRPFLFGALPSSCIALLMLSVLYHTACHVDPSPSRGVASQPREPRAASTSMWLRPFFLRFLYRPSLMAFEFRHVARLPR